MTNVTYSFGLTP